MKILYSQGTMALLLVKEDLAKLSDPAKSLVSGLFDGIVVDRVVVTLFADQEQMDRFLMERTSSSDSGPSGRGGQDGDIS